jgi:hypothetical protein
VKHVAIRVPYAHPPPWGTYSLHHYLWSVRDGKHYRIPRWDWYRRSGGAVRVVDIPPPSTATRCLMIPTPSTHPGTRSAAAWSAGAVPTSLSGSCSRYLNRFSRTSMSWAEPHGVSTRHSGTRDPPRGVDYALT